MSSVQRFLPNSRNLLRDAVLSASSVKTSTALRATSVSRTGNGRCRLTGAYTGHEATSFDVEIAAGGATMRASTPVFTGVGNGTLAATSAIGAPAETWTLTLVDLGTETTHASLQIESITLRAKTAGAAGNLVRLTITPDLEQTASNYSLLDAWPAGSATLSGIEYDFGGLPLSAKGELDADSPRIQIGNDYQVFRPYRTYKDGAWSYGIAPAPARALPAGSRVYTVTGGYDVTVTNGTTTESTTGLETFYELLAWLAGSALVEVVGVVTADRQPGGMAMSDIPLRTAAWVLSATGIDLGVVTPAVDAPTENITVECLNADAVGLESWAVTGSLSGALGTARTGATFTSDVVGFTVPLLAGTVDGSGKYTWRFTPTTRSEGEGMPDVKVKDLTLGLNARPGTYSFTYAARPTYDSCSADNATITGRVSAACLGLEGGEMATLDSNYQTRLETLYTWRSEFAAANKATVTGIRAVASGDLDLVDAVTSVFADCLEEIYASSDARTEWDAAFTALDSDLAGLEGMMGYDITALAGTYDIFEVGFLMFNPYNRHGYLVNTVTNSGTATTKTAGVAVSLVDATKYKTDGSTYDITSGTYTINVTDKGLVNDLHYGLLIGLADGNSVGSTHSAVADFIAGLTRVYKARMDKVRAIGGIVPKSNASGISAVGDGCWRDDPDATGWWVDDSGTLFPAFSNTAYISSAQSCGTGASAGVPLGEPYSTQAFGFVIAVGCEERVKAGDKISIIIESVDGAAPYRVGDKAEIKVVTAGAAYLNGGVDGDDTQEWSVVGSVTGALDNYEVPTDGSSIPAYTLLDGATSLGTLQLAAGGIPHALGDIWTFDVEAGQFRWRKGAGAWSSLTDIAASVTLTDGVTAAFTVGAAPSFVAGDAYTFDAEQPSAPSLLQTPGPEAWAWIGATATLTAEIPAGSITALGIARHSLPEGATVTVEIGDGTDWEYSATLDATYPVALHIPDEDWRVDEMVLIDADGAILGTELGEDITYTVADASHIRLSVTGATGGAIGWLWVGDSLATEESASTCRLIRQWANSRGAGINPARQYLGRGTGGEVGWDAGDDRSYLTETDRAALLAMLDDLQANAEPMIFVPHYKHADEAALVDIQFDAIEMTEVSDWGRDDKAHRSVSMSIPFAAVIE